MVVEYDNDEASEQHLINAIYRSLHINGHVSDYMSSRAILTRKNEHVDKLNAMLIEKFPGDEVIYISFDEAIDDVHNYYTDEFLNSLTPNGMPPHKLVLKKNCPIMLLRNLDPSDGLCNGTQMVCKGFDRNII
ncbi:hypothetical protein LIER_28822 [Lithospermum erythrorhizon]|uniref:DNA helicase Pif1-like 2B domain-containing protein n=1 Tax=Lithospermum erythrorhizon TaxID=34254 RepID=A0AAV3RH19_LITER